MLSLWLASIPCRPEGGKWTKLGPSLDWACIGQVTGLLRDLIDTGFAPLIAEIDTGTFRDQSQIESGCTQELNWHQVSGVRLQAGRDIPTEHRKFQTAALIVVSHPTRYLTSWFLRRSADAPRWADVPSFLDLLTLRFSPATVALQFLASVTDGSAPHLLLIAGALGLGSWEAFEDQYPDRAKATRCLARNAAAWIDRRIVTPFMCEYQNRVGAVADTRLSIQERSQISEEFHHKRACCIGPAGVRLQALTGKTLSALFSYEWQCVLRAWTFCMSWIFKLPIARLKSHIGPKTNLFFLFLCK